MLEPEAAGGGDPGRVRFRRAVRLPRGVAIVDHRRFITRLADAEAGMPLDDILSRRTAP